MKILLLALLSGFASFAGEPVPIDANATRETRSLYRNLHQLSKKGVLFGHQHATEYGHGWSGETDRSDVKAVTGSHPAVIGIDFSSLSGQPDSLIRREEMHLRKVITDTYKRGGLVTVSWHFNNPLSGGGFYWKEGISKASVREMIPGAPAHTTYKNILKGIAAFLHTVKGPGGEPVPMIFRPFHELDGSWFWWGKNHCSPDEIKALWKFTVNYLRDSMQVHQLLYAFSPDCTFQSEAEFLERYPGDAYVDMVGMDNYADFGRYGKYSPEAAVKKLQIVQRYADQSGKLAALTETGLESIPNPEWWTEVLLKAITTPGLRLSYVLVWRNDKTSPTHYYAPFPGQVSEKDFIRFYKMPVTVFEKDLPPLYTD